MQEDKTRVLILGAGFAGIRTARALTRNLRGHARQKVEITMLNRRNYHLYTPFLYQAATGLVENDDIAQPIRVKATNLGFKFVEAEINGIDLKKQKVITHSGDFVYDYLVIALGSVKNDEIIEGASEHSIPLKTLEDGDRVHNKIISSFEKSVMTPKGPERDAQLAFVVIGGSTGVELAGAIRDYTNMLQQYYSEIEMKEDCNVYVIEAHERLFPNGDKKLSMIVKKVLEEKGVNVFLNTKVASIEEGKVNLLDGRTLRSHNVFFNAGTKPSPIVESLTEDIVKKHKSGRILVNGHLRIPNFRNVFAIGDVAYYEDPESNHHEAKSPPTTAETAVEEGDYCGRQLALLLNNSSSLKRNDRLNLQNETFRYKEKGTMLSIGIHNGIAQLPSGTFTGLMGWLIWRTVHLYLVNTLQGRLRVIFDWTLGSFHKRNITHLD